MEDPELVDSQLVEVKIEPDKSLKMRQSPFCISLFVSAMIVLVSILLLVYFVLIVPRTMSFICAKDVRIESYDRLVMSIPVATGICLSVEWLQNFTQTLTSTDAEDNELSMLVDYVREILYYVGGLIFTLILIGLIYVITRIVASYMGYVYYFIQTKPRQPSLFEYIKSSTYSSRFVWKEHIVDTLVILLPNIIFYVVNKVFSSRVGWNIVGMLVQLFSPMIYFTILSLLKTVKDPSERLEQSHRSCSDLFRTWRTKFAREPKIALCVMLCYNLLVFVLVFVLYGCGAMMTYVCETEERRMFMDQFLIPLPLTSPTCVVVESLGVTLLDEWAMNYGGAFLLFMIVVVLFVWYDLLLLYLKCVHYLGSPNRKEFNGQDELWGNHKKDTMVILCVVGSYYVICKVITFNNGASWIINFGVWFGMSYVVYVLMPWVYFGLKQLGEHCLKKHKTQRYGEVRDIEIELGENL
jgi:hypothetical protein